MAAVVVAPPRVVPLMVVVEGCWMEGEAEAAMEANKTSQCTLYPRSLWHKKEKTLSPSSPTPLPSPLHLLTIHPHFHLLTFTLTPPSHSPPPHHLLTTSIFLPSPSPHPLHLLTTSSPSIRTSIFLPSLSPSTCNPTFLLPSPHPPTHILTSNLSSLTCVCVWEPPWKAPKSAKLGC